MLSDAENHNNDQTDDITTIELTQTEFGEAFGMAPSSTFVEHMFLLVDEDRSGHVSFREFMKLFLLLSSGRFNIFLLLFLFSIGNIHFIRAIPLKVT